MKILKVAFAWLTSSMMLVACGGGGGSAGTSSFNSGSVSSSPTTTAANLLLQLSGTSINNSGGQTITATATATNAAGQTLSGVPVTFSVDNNAVFTPSGTSTGEIGTVTANVSIGSDRSNRIVTVTAQSGGLTSSASFAVTGATLSGTPVPAIVTPGSTGNRVDFRLVDANNNPMAGQPITVTAGTVGSASGKTGAAGDYSFAYTAPASGTLDVTATSGGVSNTQTITVQSSGASTRPAVTTTVVSASVAADPSVVAPNDSTNTSNRVEVRALFVGPNSVPIPNMRVRFDLGGDPNNVGGTFSTGNNIVYTDALGVATTAYVPGSRSSPTDGVIVRACYDKVDFATGACPQFATKTLTVAAPPLAVTVGTDRKVIVGTLTYKQQFVVLVVDSAGVAKPNVSVVPSIDLLYFGKGSYGFESGAWVNSCTDVLTCTRIFTPIGCLNEDVNRNGVLELGEDRNGNGALDPRKSDVAVSVVGSNLTDSSGKATIQIEYPQNVASWLQYRLLVSATGVAGTEGRATWTDTLLVPISAVQDQADPPFVRSPYGVVLTCTSPN